MTLRLKPPNAYRFFPFLSCKVELFFILHLLLSLAHLHTAMSQIREWGLAG